jgi:hypothetical protein
MTSQGGIMLNLARTVSASTMLTASSLALVLASPAHAAGKLYVQSLASYAPNSGVNEKVRAECAPEASLPLSIRTHAKADEVMLTNNPGGKSDGRQLSLVLTHVDGAGGGGPWGARKSITAAGTLKQGGKVIGTFEAQRGSKGGWRTCDTFNYINNSLGKDIAGWLGSPGMNSRLGELK